jgi:hypothetical protein
MKAHFLGARFRFRLKFRSYFFKISINNPEFPLTSAIPVAEVFFALKPVFFKNELFWI